MITSKTIVIEFTKDQRRKVNEILEINENRSDLDKPGMVIGQVFRDGIVIGCIDHETALKLVDNVSFVNSAHAINQQHK